MLKIEEILEIIKTVNQSSINTFELEQGGTRLVIMKEGACLQQRPAADAGFKESPRLESSRAKPVSSDPLSGEGQQEQAPDDAAIHKIVSSMLGTFYAAAEPGAEPFVQPGQKITAGKVVCVVEAMKLFNEIEAGVDGEIVEILVRDGEFVEYGQPLFLVRPE